MAAAHNNTPKFTFPAPEIFTGEKTKARTWITECERYFTLPGVAQGLPDAPTKIFFCLVKMSGKADPWKRVKLQEYTREGGAWPTWDTFKNAFIEAFGGDDPKTKSLTKLMTMERRKMKGFELYSHLTTLDNLFTESGMTQEDQKIIWLQKTIPNEYFKNIQFDDFDTYANLVTKLKRIHKGVERVAFFNVAGIGGGTSKGKDEWAMDVDQVKIGITDVDSAPTKGTCFKCGRQGHWANKCFATTKARQGNFKSQGDMWAANSYTTSNQGKKRFGSNRGRGNFNRGNGRGRSFRGKGKGRAIRALEEDYDEDEEEQDDEDVPEEETDMGMSIRAAIRSLPKKQRELVVADLHGKGF